MAIGDLRQKFRQSSDYTQEMLIRDLIDWAYEMDEIFGAAVTPKEWTPRLTFGGNEDGITYSRQIGSYTKIGKLIHIDGEITLTSKGVLTGTAMMQGLPFKASPTHAVCILIPYAASINITAGNTLTALGYGDGTGDTGFYLRQMAATGVSTLNNTHITDTTRLIFGGTYITP